MHAPSEKNRFIVSWHYRYAGVELSKDFTPVVDFFPICALGISKPFRLVEIDLEL